MREKPTESFGEVSRLDRPTKRGKSRSNSFSKEKKVSIQGLNQADKIISMAKEGANWKKMPQKKVLERKNTNDLKNIYVINLEKQ
jgi:hypothetical protein